MKPTLITLTISLIALFTFVKLSYKHATIQDSVDKSITSKVPLDYEVE